MPSEDGWEPFPATQAQCVWITVPGTTVNLELLQGQPATIMGAYAADYNAFIEPLRDPDSAGWTPTNSVPTSNHLNGTAMDLNWNSHPFQQSYAGYTPDMIATMRDMLAFYEDTMYWGQDWNGDPFDCMHHQMGYNTYQNPHTQDFINRKIRADGFSTYRRGSTPPQPLSPADMIATVIIQTAQARGYSRDDTIACLATGIQESNLDENAVGDGGASVGVYQQDAGYPNRGNAAGNVIGFFDRLAKRGSPGASPDIWKNIFWLQQRPSEPSADQAFADGRQAYLAEIQSRIGAATDYYNRLAGPTPAPTPTPTPPGGGELTPEQDRMLQEIWHGLFDQLPSESRYGDPVSPVWNVIQFIRNMDRVTFDLDTEHDAALGDPTALARVTKAAVGGDKIAQAFLAQLTAGPVTPGPAGSAPTFTQIIDQMTQQMAELKTMLAGILG